MQNKTTMSAFLDFFYIGSAHLSDGITLSRYVDFAQGNWANVDLDSGSISNIVNNDGPKSEPKDPNRSGNNLEDPDKLDSIYD